MAGREGVGGITGTEAAKGAGPTAGRAFIFLSSGPLVFPLPSPPLSSPSHFIFSRRSLCKSIDGPKVICGRDIALAIYIINWGVGTGRGTEADEKVARLATGVTAVATGLTGVGAGPLAPLGAATEVLSSGTHLPHLLARSAPSCLWPPTFPSLPT